MKCAIAMMVACLLFFPARGSMETIRDFREILRADPLAETVDLGDVRVSSLRDLILIAQTMPNLKRLDLFQSPVSTAQAHRLAQALPGVRLGMTMVIPCRNPSHPERNCHYLRTDAEVFSTLHNNQCLFHSDMDFAALRYCGDMLALDLGHNELEDLSFLEHMPRLRVLIIGRNNVTDLSPITHCPDLEYLEAFTNNIRSVEPLLSCPRLMDLNIPNNQVRDPELFAEMKSLKRLWAFNYAWRNLKTDQVPKHIKRLVETSLPGCQVNWTCAGTNGWREDSEHYAVIQQMFNTGVYIPFRESAPLP